ncbi:MAG: bifunctional phosphoribosyl-AMP cyclohydrolase/phosphoribosyl-ATP diphosphatase HisIE [Flavobacteriaceae bacterium]|nr:bifunctional phosphoribosyl-AMP cyclohydrolase/phosphoribosyl-ATP diphosphatase HisIE [Flavobacteriaceae bacterium]NNK72778.1 bifunctional phosphoribosyl-AMP cyclohydrolase/phosphoribosyl-ATP diphosphatase HisIE [Flavobacteriaceae bacterium]
MKIDFKKNKDKLVPAIIQDSKTQNILMLGYMNEDAYNKTLETKRVTFFSRSKKRLWTKGEESGNYLELVSLKVDCDQDTLLIQAIPNGPTCHKGSDTCWDETNASSYGFLTRLEAIIKDRQTNSNAKESYVSSLFEKGINKIAQKVGEEAVETVIEAKDSNDDLFLAESADLLFHLMVLLRAKGFELRDVVDLLESRHK